MHDLDRSFARRGARPAALAVAALLATGPCFGARAADAPAVGLELNKLEPQPKGCRVYFMVDNAAATPFQSFRLDLAILKKDRTIDRRIAFDLAPLRASKRSVKLFDASDLPCDDIGSILLNDVIECRSGDVPSGDCLDRVKLSSRVAGVDFGK